MNLWIMIFYMKGTTTRILLFPIVLLPGNMQLSRFHFNFLLASRMKISLHFIFREKIILRWRRKPNGWPQFRIALFAAGVVFLIKVLCRISRIAGLIIIGTGIFTNVYAIVVLMGIIGM